MIFGKREQKRPWRTVSLALGGIAAAGAIFVTLLSLPEFVRYLRIRRM
jgi:hypothetical protein